MTINILVGRWGHLSIYFYVHEAKGTHAAPIGQAQETSINIPRLGDLLNVPSKLCQKTSCLKWRSNRKTTGFNSVAPRILLL